MFASFMTLILTFAGNSAHSCNKWLSYHTKAHRRQAARISDLLQYQLCTRPTRSYAFRRRHFFFICYPSNSLPAGCRPPPPPPPYHNYFMETRSRLSWTCFTFALHASYLPMYGYEPSSAACTLHEAQISFYVGLTYLSNENLVGDTFAILAPRQHSPCESARPAPP